MKMQSLFIIMLLVTANLWCARKALLIGNAAYPAEAALSNPVNDATDLAQTLESLGFEVQIHQDLGLRAMTQAISKFSASVQSGDEVLFYYSGHGAQTAGVNYLIPIDKEISTEEDLEWDAYPAERVLSSLAKADVSIIVLDACRDNPFKAVRSSNRGLVAMNARAGSQYIIFSTEQGKTAADGLGQRNSPFTSAFIHHISNSTKKIEDLMKDVSSEVREKTNQYQTPWLSGSLIRDFYFRTDALSPDDSAPRKPKVQQTWTYGGVSIESDLNGILYIDGEEISAVTQGQQINISDIKAGKRLFRLESGDQALEKILTLKKNEVQDIYFSFADLAAYGGVMNAEDSTNKNVSVIHRDEIEALIRIIKQKQSELSKPYREIEALRQCTGTISIELSIDEEGAVASAVLTPVDGTFKVEDLEYFKEVILSWKFPLNTKLIYKFEVRFDNTLIEGS